MRQYYTILFFLYGQVINGHPQRNPSLIVGGIDADISEVPYTVSLQYYGRHSCGGTIVSEHLVVTAAHCVYGNSNDAFTIRAGSTFSNTEGQLRKVEYYKIHDLYAGVDFDYDIAVLKLSEPLVLGATVSILELGNPDIDIKDGSPAVISGWGRTSEGGLLATVLQKAIVPIVNQNFCSKAYNEYGFKITARMVCAGAAGGGLDACQGDSGGPLVVADKLVGVVSWGIGCARPGIPGVYSKVSALREWLDYEIKIVKHSNGEDLLGVNGALDKNVIVSDDYKEGYLPKDLLSNVVNTGRIVGGEEADISDIPYIVSLQIPLFGHTCGGTIADKDIVITAAHCVIGSSPSRFTIRAGSNLTTSGGQTREVKSIGVHERYSSSTLDYDIAVLTLSEPLEFGTNVRAAKLPDSSTRIQDGESARVSGWGTTREGGSAARELQTVIVPIVNQDSCADSYKYFYDITPRMLCAGIATGGKDACQGDSGGPLVINGFLVGAVSWGMGCARPDYPGVYTRVSELRDWVDNTIIKLRLQ